LLLHGLSDQAAQLKNLRGLTAALMAAGDHVETMEAVLVAVRNQIHQKANAGFLRETEMWTLISDAATGAQTVAHEWSYVDPFGQGKPDCGVSTVTVENFLTGSADDSVKQKLRAILVSSRNS
jgi:hypothetical protein